MKHLAAALLLIISGGIALVSTFQGFFLLASAIRSQGGAIITVYLALVCVSIGFSAGTLFVATARQRPWRQR